MCGELRKNNNEGGNITRRKLGDETETLENAEGGLWIVCAKRVAIENMTTVVITNSKKD